MAIGTRSLNYDNNCRPIGDTGLHEAFWRGAGVVGQSGRHVVRTLAPMYSTERTLSVVNVTEPIE